MSSRIERAHKEYEIPRHRPIKKNDPGMVLVHQMRSHVLVTGDVGPLLAPGWYRQQCDQPRSSGAHCNPKARSLEGLRQQADREIYQGRKPVDGKTRFLLPKPGK